MMQMRYWYHTPGLVKRSSMWWTAVKDCNVLHNNTFLSRDSIVPENTSLAGANSISTTFDLSAVRRGRFINYHCHGPTVGVINQQELESSND